MVLGTTSEAVATRTVVAELEEDEPQFALEWAGWHTFVEPELDATTGTTWPKGGESTRNRGSRQPETGLGLCDSPAPVSGLLQRKGAQIMLRGASVSVATFATENTVARVLVFVATCAGCGIPLADANQVMCTGCTRK